MAKINIKAVMKVLPAIAIGNAERGVGFGAASYAVKELFPKALKNNANADKIMKASGPAMFIVGTVGEAFVGKNAHVRAVCQGVATYGVVKSAVDFAPESADLKGKLGLQGMSEVSGIGANATEIATDWDALVNEAIKTTKTVNGNPTEIEIPVNGMDITAND